MILIYDFDGTLTPSSMPEYQVLKDCGYSNEKLFFKISELIKEKNIALVDAYFIACLDILKENKLKLNQENLCIGADKVILNKGVLDYFRHFQSSNIKHYVITSGFQDYVEKTKVNEYLTKVYGTTLKKKNDEYTDVEMVVTDTLKAKIISNIAKNKKETIVYFGDGLTDKAAFEYVHSIGGQTVFIAKEETKEYIELNKLGIIDNLFYPDFCKGSEIYNYVENLLEEEK